MHYTETRKHGKPNATETRRHRESSFLELIRFGGQSGYVA